MISCTSLLTGQILHETPEKLQVQMKSAVCPLKLIYGLTDEVMRISQQSYRTKFAPVVMSGQRWACMVTSPAQSCVKACCQRTD